MKKFSNLIYFLILAILVFSLSGCMSHTPRQYGNSNSGGGGSYQGGDGGYDSKTPTDLTITTETRGDFGEVTKIVLSPVSTSSVNLDDNSIPVYDCVWNVTPEAGEYWIYNGDTYDDEQDVQEAMGIDEDEYGVYIAHDIRYIPNTLNFSTNVTAPKEQTGQDECYVVYYSTEHPDVDKENKYILAALPKESSSSISTMTHSASDAYNNPVLHITKPGTYALSGTWNGQIWVDIPDGSITSGTKTKKDSEARVVLILDSLDVTCTVAPALVFKNVYEYAGNYNGNNYDDKDGVKAASMDVGSAIAAINNGEAVVGATIILGKDMENTLTGTNLARLNKAELNDDYTDSSLIGQFVKAQSKMYKLDGTLHSRMSMVIDNEDDTTDGTLVINSSYEGLDSEEHMYIANGDITVTASDDGINVNDDNVSVFHMDGGSLTVTSTSGDGIDSNGYIIFTGADSLIVSAARVNSKPSYENLDAQAEGLLDSDCGIYMTQAVYEVFDVGENSGSTGNGSQPGGQNPPDGG
ncbi:MAG: carbohydrate-binding domain-containing protein, partial [Synergistaceae bacterium]|nr:carbohydrate-binding domain-containing protein [Synergistaceae bacterium]